jgi:GNAT superfamily N-acetyltransferase
MSVGIHILARSIAPRDKDEWRPLWDAYNAFYGRTGATALDEDITARTWRWFFESGSNVLGFVAELDRRVVGIAHCVIHRSTSRAGEVCYLQDLFVSEAHRGSRVGRVLLDHAIQSARNSGCSRIYWQTQATNVAGRALYDRVAQHRGCVGYSREL